MRAGSSHPNSLVFSRAPTMTQALTLRLQAALDLLRRYTAIFSQVWKIRKELDPDHIP